MIIVCVKKWINENVESNFTESYKRDKFSNFTCIWKINFAVESA